jgi:hypothetical protein
MENYKQSDFMFDDLFLDFDSEDFHIKWLIKMSSNVKYFDKRAKKEEKLLDESFLKAIKYIEDKSMDITQMYTCAPAIGLSLAIEYGENARDCFHKICKNNIEYNVDKCNKEYSKYLKADSKLVSMVLFYCLYAVGAADELKAVINKMSKVPKA